MDIFYQWAIIIGILLAIPVILAIILLIVGLIVRFSDTSSTRRKHKQLDKAGDSMGVRYSSDDY